MGGVLQFPTSRASRRVVPVVPGAATPDTWPVVASTVARTALALGWLVVAGGASSFFGLGERWESLLVGLDCVRALED